MTKVVEKLEHFGFISRTVDPHDRRVSRVAITPAGRRHLDSTRDRRTAWLAGRLQGLEPDQLGQLVAALPALEALITGDGGPR
jgi:DNA-binding MarR family transcriptional regulator